MLLVALFFFVFSIFLTVVRSSGRRVPVIDFSNRSGPRTRLATFQRTVAVEEGGCFRALPARFRARAVSMRAHDTLDVR